MINFDTQILNFEGKLTGYANKLTCNREKAKDLLHDTFCKALANKDKFKEDSNLKAWLYSIMKNTYINEYRRAVKGNKIFDYTKDLIYQDQNKHMILNSGSNHSIKDILIAIDSLHYRHRLPFMMSFEGYTYKEIARLLNLPLGTVKIHIFNARKKLQTILK